MPENSLWLYPSDIRSHPERGVLEQRLSDIGFLGESFSFDDRENYRPGSRFLQLVTFLGCSPVVSLGEPGRTGGEFCRIEFITAPAPRLVAGDNAKTPRCPNCRARFEQWPELLTREPTSKMACGQCGEPLSPCALDWRHYAGCGRFFLKVWGIFESEALPGDELMRVLAETGGGPWDYFYYRKV